MGREVRVTSVGSKISTRRGLASGVAIAVAFMLSTTSLPHAQPSRFKPEELEQIVAPIVQYPDSLLAQIFMASTYPLEVIQAARFVKANPGLKGETEVVAQVGAHLSCTLPWNLSPAQAGQ